jgi:predicted dehydrogenase
MTGGPPKVGLVGVGLWGQYILRDLMALGAEVHAAVRSEDSRLRAQRGGAASIVEQIDALPSDCDGYIVANITTAHLDAVEVLLKRGRPLFVEKPLSNDLARVRRLPPIAEKLVFTMHKWRYHPGIIALAQIAAREEFGPVRGLRTYRLGWEHHHDDVSSLWVLLPHDLSIALHVFGEVPRPVGAWSDPLTPHGDGVVARFLAARDKVDFIAEISSGHLEKNRRVVLACRDAVCQLNDARYDRIAIKRRGDPADAPLEERVVDADLPLKAELRIFLEHLRGGPPPMTGLPDEIRIIEAVTAIQDMMAS